MNLDAEPIAIAAPLVHERAFDLIREEPRGRVLDVPAGEGAFALRLLNDKFSVHCGDLLRNSIPDLANRSVILDLNTGLPYRGEMFDLVVCIEGIEHVENPHHLVGEIWRVLKPGGKCLISTPNVLSLRSRLSYLLYGYPNYFHYMKEVDPESGQERKIDHINPITFLELRYILAQKGFEIENVSANRLLKKGSVMFLFLKKLLEQRGKRYENDLVKGPLRRILFSEPLLYGEILIIKAVKRP